MKKDIHQITVKSLLNIACGKFFTTRSTKEGDELKIDICRNVILFHW